MFYKEHEAYQEWIMKPLPEVNCLKRYEITDSIIEILFLLIKYTYPKRWGHYFRVTEKDFDDTITKFVKSLKISDDYIEKSNCP